MTSYYTRANARGEQEDVEQGDSALGTTTTTVSEIATVGLQGASTEGLESMSTEVAGPMTTNPQLLPEGGHSSVGGHGSVGSASSSLVGVSTLGYPSGLADPLDSSIASKGQITAESGITTATLTTGNVQVTSRQPPTTAAEVTAAAFSSPALDAQVVEMPARDRRRSSSVTLSPPTLSPAPDLEQSQSVLHRIGRAASLQRAASSQRRSFQVYYWYLALPR